jgi:CDGSH-type Zn-finger protein/uncharacterized Fe-S cluster protein YjdI
MSDVEEVRGKHLLLRFEARKCIHSRQCVLARPDVFVPNVSGEWIHPDAVPVDQVVAVAQSCPSGAITFERLDGEAGEIAPGVNTIRVRENGPLAFHGALSIAGTPVGFRATLCRCGASKRKPYCDGSHAAAGFAATGEPASAESAALEARDGAVAIEPTPNGPLKVEGNLELVSGTGRTLLRTTKTFLCRCGASSKKPYCDGTHAKIGFTST